jgi:pyruvate/2-oxoglutarate dehydrogenase complex dihydrolipoamide acyltransferase (E2) component
MSNEAVRAIALQEATKLHAGTGVDVATVLKTAAILEGYVAGAQAAVVHVKTPPTAPAVAQAPAKAAAPKVAPKPPAPKVAPKPPAKTEDQLYAEMSAKHLAEEAAADGEEITGEMMSGLVKGLLAAGLRAETLALLAKYNAKSASSVPVESRAAFYEEGANLMPLDA